MTDGNAGIAFDGDEESSAEDFAEIVDAEFDNLDYSDNPVAEDVLGKPDALPKYIRVSLENGDVLTYAAVGGFGDRTIMITEKDCVLLDMTFRG